MDTESGSTPGWMMKREVLILGMVMIQEVEKM